jgi:hypothetical protein
LVCCIKKNLATLMRSLFSFFWEPWIYVQGWALISVGVSLTLLKSTLLFLLACTHGDQIGRICFQMVECLQWAISKKYRNTAKFWAMYYYSYVPMYLFWQKKVWLCFRRLKKLVWSHCLRDITGKGGDHTQM